MPLDLRYYAENDLKFMLGVLERGRETYNSGLLCDALIEHLVKITPFHKGDCPPGKISYGLQSYGYDLRLGYNFRIFTDTYSEVVDPKKMSGKCFTGPFINPENYDGNGVVLPANSFTLAESIEEMEIPRSVLAIGIGKSTYARCGIIVNVTPIEPEWRGKLTLEITNSSPLPVRVYPDEGICQLVFFRANVECLRSYNDKKGRYQDQRGLTLPSVNPK